MNKKLKKRLKKIVVGGFLFILAILLSSFREEDRIISFSVFLISYLVVGYDVIKKAARNIISGQIFDENFLMLIATLGAFAVKEYPEAVAVMLFYQIGEWFQSYAVNNSRKSIKDMMDICPEEARVYEEGKEIIVDPSEVEPGQIILVKAGERVPLDGIIVKGKCSLDTKALTGESIPRDVEEGERVISGCINLNSMIEVRVTKCFTDSTVVKILDLVENASSNKAVTEKFITRFARYYTPVVVVLAVLLAVIPSLLTGEFSVWGYRALSFLVISCPCALVISVPLSFFGGIGGAGKQGVLIKGSNYLELLAQADTVVMDKTGTLTKGSFEVSEIYVIKEGISKEDLLEAAAYAEYASNHPISKSLQKAYGKEISAKEIKETKEIPGYGVEAWYQGKKVFVGNEKWMVKLGLTLPQITVPGTLCHVAVSRTEENTGTEDNSSSDENTKTEDNSKTEKNNITEENLGADYWGYIVISDLIKEDSIQCIRELKQSGIQRIVMLTGDNYMTAKAVADQLDMKEFYADLFPQDKVSLTEKFLKESENTKKLIFVGDGMNDAPVLARADIGIAMGGLGADVSIEAADIVIMNDQPSKIVTAIRISKKTLRIVKQNIIMAIGIKIAVLLLAAVGAASMWAAVFADVGVAFLAILNAMRAMKVKE